MTGTVTCTGYARTATIVSDNTGEASNKRTFLMFVQILG